MDIPIFIINLKRHPDRRDHIIRQIRKLKLCYELLEAVDGEEISDDEMTARKKDGIFMSNLMYSRYLRKGELGCTLSHVKIYQKIIEHNIEIACILEDDVVLNEKFPDILKSDKIGSENWDIMMLGHHSKHEHCTFRGGACTKQKTHIYKDCFIGLPIELPKGSYAYLIKQNAARKLLCNAFPIRLLADDLVGGAAGLGLKVVLLTPPQVIHIRGLFPSTTEPGAIEFISPTAIIQDIKGHIKTLFPMTVPIWHHINPRLSKIGRTPLMILRKHGILQPYNGLKPGSYAR